MTQQTNEIPMMDCPSTSCEGGKWDSGAMMAECEVCQGTGQVPDLDRIRLDIASKEKDCPSGEGSAPGRRVHGLMFPGCICDGTGKAPLFPTLRKECGCKGKDVHLIKPSPCQGRGWVPDVDMPKLMVALIGGFSITMDTNLYEMKFKFLVCSMNSTPWKSGKYKHSDPYIALLGAVQKAVMI